MRFTDASVRCLLVVLSGAVCGCASPQRTATAPSADVLALAPADFTIDITILTGKAIERAVRESVLRERADPVTLVVQRQQSKLVLLADGSLHYGTHPHRGADWLPPWSRRLSREQVAEVWSLLHQLGFDDPAAADDMGNLTLIEESTDEIVHIVAITGDGRRWQFVRRTPGGAAPDGATTALIRRLAALAWASDGQYADTVMLPVRYDFGPDPYATYRKDRP
jgi:hypothetical protein